MFLNLNVPRELEVNKAIEMVKSCLVKNQWQELKFRRSGCVILEKLLHLPVSLFSYSNVSHSNTIFPAGCCGIKGDATQERLSPCAQHVKGAQLMMGFTIFVEDRLLTYLQNSSNETQTSKTAREKLRPMRLCQSLTSEPENWFQGPPQA